MSDYEEAADAVLAALDAWQDLVWHDINAAVEDSEGLADWQGANPRIVDLWRRTIDSARLILRSMQDQSIAPDLTELLSQIAEEPIHFEGLDARRLGLTKIGGRSLRQQLEAEVLRHLAWQLQGRGDEQMDRFDLLFLAALDEPAQLMPIAHDYLKRAARLLILGLDLECIVFCRAALEAALKQRIDDHEMAVRVGKPPRKGWDYKLWQRIEAARVEPAFFDEDLKTRAFALKDDGDMAVHADVRTYASKLDAVKSFTTLARAVRKLLLVPAK